MAHLEIILSTSEVMQQAAVYFASLPRSIPWARRVALEADYVSRLTAEPRLRERRAQRGVPSAPTRQQQEAAAALTARDDLQYQYQTGPRRGQRLAAMRQAKG